jgi:hypothetical protein
MFLLIRNVHNIYTEKGENKLNLATIWVFKLWDCDKPPLKSCLYVTSARED